MSKNTFGDKVKVSYETFGIGEFYSAYYPKILVNGRWCYITDENYKTGKLNDSTREKAKKLGLEALKRIVETHMEKEAI